MKVLFVAGDSDYSGATLSMVALIEFLRADGVESEVVLPGKGKIEDVLVDKKIEYNIVQSRRWICPLNEHFSVKVFVRRTKDRIKNLLSVIKIANIIKRGNFDIVHVNTLAPYVGALAALISGKPYVWHIREFGEEDHGQTLWNKKAGYKLISKATTVITISNALKDKYTQAIPSANITMVYNGIDIDKFLYEREKYFYRNIVNITISGRPSEGKGQLELLQAVNLLKDNYECFRVRLVGGYGKKDYVEKVKKYISDNDIGPWVNIVGFKEDMPKVWRDSDICVVCSRSEAFGRVTIEAMLSGCLVIGADTGGTVELISNDSTGLLYEQGNPVSLYEKLDYALKNKDKMKQIAEAGQVEACHKYTAKENEQKILKVYHDILNQKTTKVQ